MVHLKKSTLEHINILLGCPILRTCRENLPHHFLNDLMSAQIMLSFVIERRVISQRSRQTINI